MARLLDEAIARLGAAKLGLDNVEEHVQSVMTKHPDRADIWAIAQKTKVAAEARLYSAVTMVLLISAAEKEAEEKEAAEVANA